MNIILIFSFLAHMYLVNCVYNIHSSNEGWWGNIHHLSQLTLLANTEELKLVPEISHIKLELHAEKVTIEQKINKLRNRNLRTCFTNLRSVLLRFKFKTKTVLQAKFNNIISKKLSSTPIHVTSRDLFMSVNSILHVHQLYGIKLISGYLHNTFKGGFLNILSNLIIGMIALSRGMNYRAVEWIEPLLLYKITKAIQKFEQLQSVLYYVAIQEHNRILYKSQSNKYTVKELYQMYTNLYIEPIKHRSSQMTTKITSYPPKFADLFDRSSLQSKFTDLCRGKIIQTSKTKTILNCYHDQYKHPYFYLKPLKVEQLSKNPPIVQYYDVLGNKTINYMKAFKEVLINPNTLYGDQSKYLGFEDVATYARRNMQNHVYKNYPQFGMISEYLTGLKIRSIPGPLLWAEYTYGRMVGVHEDTAGDPDNFDGLVTLLNKGEMIAALMFYIDTPHEGGQTPYLQSGVRAEAVKGSAVFWMTSYRNGSRRRDVHHAGCPVLHGNKIVMITPIWYNANWNHHKCTLNSCE